MDTTLLGLGKTHRRVWIIYLDTVGIHIGDRDAFLRSHGFHRISGDPIRPMGVLCHARS